MLETSIHKSRNESKDLRNIILEERNNLLNNESIHKNDLNDANLARLFHDIFGAGVETTSTTFVWLILFMLSNEKFEKRLRTEISGVIGDRLPVLDDRDRCHYVMAFIHETLRTRAVAPVGVPHKNHIDYIIGE
jgi:cytochrome P450